MNPSLKHLAGWAVFILASAAAFASPPLRCTAVVRRHSCTSDVLFRDLLGAPGGIGAADQLFHPDAGAREVIEIRVITPYAGTLPGLEDWVIAHGSGLYSTYAATLQPDGHGGTYFSIRERQAPHPPPLVVGAGETFVLPAGKAALIPFGAVATNISTNSTVTINGHHNLVDASGRVLIRVPAWATQPADNLILAKEPLPVGPIMHPAAPAPIPAPRPARPLGQLPQERSI